MYRDWGITDLTIIRIVAARRWLALMGTQLPGGENRRGTTSTTFNRMAPGA